MQRFISFFCLAFISAHLYANPAPESPARVSGKSEIRSITVVNEDGLYYANIDYYYNGDPLQGRLAVAAIEYDFFTKVDKNDFGRSGVTPSIENALQGNHKAKILLVRSLVDYEKSVTSNKILATLGSGNTISRDKSGVYKEIDFRIKWPDNPTYEERMQFANKDKLEIYKEVQFLIDAGDRESLNKAKYYLDKTILKNPDYLDLYVQYARYALKANTGKEGMRQAESYLLTALKADKKHAGALVKLGQVYLLQGRLNEAEKTLKQAKEIGTDDPLLWGVWGDLYLEKNLPKLAIVEYKKAIQQELNYAYENTRLYVYYKLFNLLDKKANLAELNNLYLKRAKEFESTNACYYIDYAMFKVENTDDYVGATKFAKEAINKGCDSQTYRVSAGVVHYLAWFNDKSAQKNTFLIQAETLTPKSAVLFYQLARSRQGNEVLSKLLKTNDEVDTPDEYGFTALAHALHNNHTSAAKVLLGLKANAQHLVGAEKYPVAFITIFNENLETTNLLIQQKVDFNKIKYRNLTGLDYAKKTGNSDLIKLIENASLSKT